MSLCFPLHFFVCIFCSLAELNVWLQHLQVYNFFKFSSLGKSSGFSSWILGCTLLWQRNMFLKLCFQSFPYVFVLCASSNLVSLRIYIHNRDIGIDQQIYSFLHAFAKQLSEHSYNHNKNIGIWLKYGFCLQNYHGRSNNSLTIGKSKSKSYLA